jgi:hypothetical protein
MLSMFFISYGSPSINVNALVIRIVHSRSKAPEIDYAITLINHVNGFLKQVSIKKSISSDNQFVEDPLYNADRRAWNGCGGRCKMNGEKAKLDILEITPEETSGEM